MPVRDKPTVPAVVRNRRRIGCTNRVLTAYLDDIEVRPGVNVADFMVIEPNNQNADEEGATGVAILPICAGKVGLLGVYRHAMAEAGWEVPRGFIDVGERSETAAHRELVEETGLSCLPAHLRSLGTICQEPGVLKARTALYVALDCREGVRLETNEPGLGALEYFTPDEVSVMVAESIVEDSCTLVAWYRYMAAFGN
jgi:ADP-ribose pyrophosphatase YjhB (NUDIX family)